jgi:Ca2+/H+ antiporter
MVALILPIAYIIGLIFTLKTHAHLFTPESGTLPTQISRSAPISSASHAISSEASHGGPDWSWKTAILVLVVSTAAFAAISEEMVPIFFFFFVLVTCTRSSVA